MASHGQSFGCGGALSFPQPGFGRSTRDHFSATGWANTSAPHSTVLSGSLSKSRSRTTRTFGCQPKSTVISSSSAPHGPGMVMMRSRGSATLPVLRITVTLSAQAGRRRRSAPFQPFAFTRNVTRPSNG